MMQKLKSEGKKWIQIYSATNNNKNNG